MAQAMRGNYFSAGDMGMRDEDGYIYLVDRKANMIISGGENIFPTEVENCVGSYSKVKDVAVIGVPHEKWGEQVMSMVVLHEGQTATEKRSPATAGARSPVTRYPRTLFSSRMKKCRDRGQGRSSTGYCASVTACGRTTFRSSR